MEKYWIIVNGRPEGPFAPEQLKLRRDFVADLPVWTTGMADWTVVSEVPALAALLEEVAAAEAAAAEQPQQEFQQQTGYVQQPLQGGGFTPQPAAAMSVPAEPMPPSYLAWNIVMTLCCCMIIGVIGIIFSAQVAQKWQRGDIEGARKSSERAAWCLILSLVLGLVSMPFQMLIQMASL